MSSSPASKVAAGDIDGDNIDDLIAVWASGVWVKNSATKAWTKITSNLPTDIATGDMSGDGRVDVIGSWSTGVWYRNSTKGTWVLMSSSPATLVAAGDIDDDSTDDLIGVWTTGIWIKKSSTMGWVKLTGALPPDIDAGLYRALNTADVGAFASPVPINSEAPGTNGKFEDLSNEGPGGRKFNPKLEENLIPFESNPEIVLGPGDPGLQFELQENLLPREELLIESNNKYVKAKR